MNGNDEMKRRQHYVWRHYLAAWAPDDRLWCQRGSNRFPTGTRGIAVRKDFYRIQEIGPREVDFVQQFIIQRSAPHLRQVLSEWIPLFTSLHKLKALHDASGGNDPDIERDFEIAINNAEEELHARIERSAIPLLAALRDRDAAFLNDPKAFSDFAIFIAMQYMRTPQLRRKAVGALSSLKAHYNINIEAAWGLMRTMYSTNIGSAIVARRELLKLTFLDVPPDAEFIASDQPLINLRAVGEPEGTVPTELEYYYPVSPKLAILLDVQHGSMKVARRSLTRAEVVDLNGKLAAHCEEQFFAASEAALDLVART